MRKRSEMNQEKILRLLIQADGSISGEEMSRYLGVTRAAVWKGIEGLRGVGYEIVSVPGQGYRLVSSPNRLSEGAIQARLRAENLVGREVVCLERVDSTNTYLKRRGAEGASHGLAAVAEEQTGGRGRRGRRFESPKGSGLYLSVLLRPECRPSEAAALTAWVGVAVCDAVEEVAGVRPQIKWTNDIILNGKKLCGILTELSVEGETGAVDYVVAGMGTNVGETRDFFAQAGLSDIATSLAIEGRAVDRCMLASAQLNALDRMAKDFPQNKARWLERYRADCLTPGHEVRLIGPEGERSAMAVAIDDSFGLVVVFPDGTTQTVTSGEVSVRGVAGYV